MAIKKVRFFGPIGNTSGYGIAVKNFASAFSESNIPTKFHFAKNWKDTKFVQDLNQYSGDTDIDFYLHPPPWSKHKSGKYKIGYFYWEADRLPRGWGRALNQVDEIWTPCNVVANACRREKFSGPIKVIPTPGREFLVDKNLRFQYEKDNVLSENIYVFYSIFQWHFRKGYDVLLSAYYSNFTINDNVVLVLKVNPLNVNGYKKENILEDIRKIKKIYKDRDDLPMVYLSDELVPGKDIERLHSVGDCYVSPHRGEGWGMPIFDAIHANSNVIVTNYGGITEYLNENSANFIKFKLGPVRNMEWSPFYNKTQFWAEPSVSDLGRKMVESYQNHDSFARKRENAKKTIAGLNIKALIEIINQEFDR